MSAPAQARGRIGPRMFAIVLVAVVVSALAGGALVAYDGAPVPATRVQQSGGEAVLASDLPLPVVDLGDGKGAASLAGVYHDIGVANYANVIPVPLDGGTLLVGRTNGAFNFLEPGDVVEDAAPGGVALGASPANTLALAYPSGSAAFIVRLEPNRIVVDLVNPALVAQAARHPGRRLHPLGYASLSGGVASPPTQIAATAQALYLLLVRSHTRSELVALERTPGHGLGLRARTLATVANPSAIESLGDRVLIDSDGRLETAIGLRLHAEAAAKSSATPTAIWPVRDAAAPGWFVERTAAGHFVLAAPQRSARRIVGLGRVAPRGIIVPAEDAGKLYTMGVTGTREDPLVTIAVPSGVLGRLAKAPDYPLEAQESPTLATTTVHAFGAQLIYDCSNALLAVVVFTGSNQHVEIVDKGVLPSVDPNAPAGAIGSSHPHHSHAPTKKTPNGPTPAKPAPQPAVQTVTAAINCATADQKPSIPEITSVQPGPQSASISWSYPLISADSCEPSTYEVALTPENGAPPLTTPDVAVNGVTQTIVSGLHSGQTYQVVVTAFIGTSSTPSAPVDFTTTPEGADAPLSVASTFEPGQGWLVTWTSCQGNACNVPAASWTVTGQPCGSSTGFIGAAPSVTVSAPNDQALVPLTPSLVGESLTFDVAGTSAKGLVGNPTASTGCQLGYQAPNPADLLLSASETPTTAGEAQAVLQVSPATGTTLSADLGSPEIEFQYCIAHSTTGPCADTQTSSTTTANFTNLELGTTYYARVTLVPSIDPGLAATLTDPSPISATVPWPTITTSVAQFQASSTNPDLGQLGVDLTTSNATGLSVDIAAATLACSSAETTLTPVSPTTTIGATGAAVTFTPFPLTDVAPPCQLSLTLAPTSGVNPYNTPTTTTDAAVAAPSPAPSGTPTFSAVLSGPGVTTTSVTGCSPSSTNGGATLTICEAQDATGFTAPWGSWTLEQLDVTVGSNPGCQVTPLPSSTTDQPVAVPIASCLTGGFYQGESLEATGTIAWSYLGTTSTIRVSDSTTFDATTTSFTTAMVNHQGVVTVQVDEDSQTGPTGVDGGSFSVTANGQPVDGCTSASIDSTGGGTCTLSLTPGGTPSLTATYSPPSSTLLASSDPVQLTQ